ncbi:unnamed protein product [Amoebophrya sp. A120]|nr:unnamed protein product [Amoebophrya sp. A120]|eukprot:GSA120T00022457001.1
MLVASRRKNRLVLYGEFLFCRTPATTKAHLIRLPHIVEVVLQIQMIITRPGPFVLANARPTNSYARLQGLPVFAGARFSVLIFSVPARVFHVSWKRLDVLVLKQVIRVR